MKFFEAQKRASFATKLFATVGFDFEAALKANNETALKTAFDAHASPAVAALFTAAALDQAALVAAGPDALKLHIESLDNSEELAAALEANEDLQTKLTEAGKQLSGMQAQVDVSNEIFDAIGIEDPINPEADAAGIKKAFEAHVAKQTTLALAKTGHPPAHVPKVDAPDTAVATDEQLLAEYEKMEAGDKRLAFYSKHEAALNRAGKARRTTK